MLIPRPSFLLAALLLAGGSTPPPAQAVVSVPDGFASEVIVPGLDQPTSMAFLPDGRLLITEQRTARVRMVVDGHIAATDPVLVVPNVFSQFYEQGLQGIAVDPGWPDRPYVYLFHNRRETPGVGTSGRCRLVRYTASGDLANPFGESLSLADPLLLIDDIPDSTQWHQAGCLRFGPDGMLYVSLGDDDQRPCVAADSTSLRGQILRLNVNDLPPGPGDQVPRSLITPAGNPLSTSDTNAAMVFAYGMRNPWRFHIDPVTAKLYVCDVGEADFEELTEVEPGNFLGWPWREGFLIMDRPECPEPGGPGNAPFKEPMVAFGRGSELTAIFAAGIYRPVFGAPSDWPAAYDGDVFYGEYYSGFFRRMKLQDGVWSAAPAVPGQPNATDWGTGFTSAVDFLVGPDGSLWWLRQFDDAMNSASGSVQRIRYLSPTTGVPPLPASGLALGAGPNPFGARVEISFRLDRASLVTLAIHDIAGRRLRVLRNAESPAGETRVVWDGRDEAGRAVPPGIYLARLSRPGASATLRLLRIE